MSSSAPSSSEAPSPASQALLLLDADFVPAPALAAQVKAPGAYAELMQRLSAPQAIVVPALQTGVNVSDGRRYVLDVVQSE